MKECFMKKAVFGILALALVMSVVACGSAPAAAPVTVDQPEWLNDFPPEDALWGIGIAKQSSANMSMTTAEARAR
ncbi:MAG: hypothetical protein LBN21_05670, partial [Treponema sp.]|nr:hypothetical protein [Treponema sp.]